MMRLTLALAALVAVTSALPYAPQPALTTREDFVEDDFEIQAEPDDIAKRQVVAGIRSVDWPEVSPSTKTKHLTPTVHSSVHPSIHPIAQAHLDTLCSIYSHEAP